jgi:hypothetical protein
MSPQSASGSSDSNLSNKPERPHLAVHEWLAVIVIIGCFATLTCLSLIFDKSIPDNTSSIPHYLKPQYIEVLVQGAVELPGSYKMSSSAKLKELIALANPIPEADLRHLKLEGKLRNGQVVKIQTRQHIDVYVSGAVENPGKLRVPQGTKLNELGNYAQLSTHADTNKINRKRILKSEEVIVVPSR